MNKLNNLHFEIHFRHSTDQDETTIFTKNETKQTMHKIKTTYHIELKLHKPSYSVAKTEFIIHANITVSQLASPRDRLNELIKDFQAGSPADGKLATSSVE